MATKWSSDAAHSEIEFKVKHMMITNVKGNFNSFAVNIDGQDFTTDTVVVNIDTASISTNNADRDNHLKSADFLTLKNILQ